MRLVADTEEELQRHIRMLAAAGMEIVTGPNIMHWAEMRPALRQWWETLTPGKDRIKPTRDKVTVYKDFGQTAFQTYPTQDPRWDFFGYEDGWIQVLRSRSPLFPSGLWVQATDVEAV